MQQTAFRSTKRVIAGSMLCGASLVEVKIEHDIFQSAWTIQKWEG